MALQNRSRMWTKAKPKKKELLTGSALSWSYCRRRWRRVPVLKDLLVVYNEEGQPDAVNYDRIAIALITYYSGNGARIKDLEAKLNS
jgi:uncharacterized membrane protein YkvA (DUF1232 family)